MTDLETLDRITVGEALARCVARFGDGPAHRIKRADGWHTVSWQAYSDTCHTAAKGFVSLGLEPGEGVCIIGFNCHQWVVADVAAILAGGVPAGIYTTNAAEQCLYIAEHSESAIAVVEDEAQLAKFMEIWPKLPKLKAIVMMRGEPPEDARIFSWAQLLARGEAESDDALEKRLADQKPDDLCTLIYTSGTTGDPKAVMMSHDNFVWTAGVAIRRLGAGPSDLLLSYLPMSHVAEQAVVIHGPMAVGTEVAFAESMDLLGENLKETQPTLFVGVPRVWEKIQAKIQLQAAKNSPLKRKLGAWARKQGLAGGKAEQAGHAKGLGWHLASRIVFSKVRKALGLERARMVVTTAAPISRDTLDFFLSLGLPLCEVYGMSECTGPATLSTPDRYQTGSAGWLLPGTELKIAEDGEICIRGRHVFKGYLKNPAATQEAIDDDGWLHSGDIGTMDERGFLRITDRKKDLIITAGGENIAPQLIEGKLKAISVVSQAVVVGDRMKYLGALLTLDPDKVVGIAKEIGANASTAQEASQDAVFLKYLDKEVAQINGSLARVQTIKHFRVLPEDFSIEGGELTPTMKIRRRVVAKKYASSIEEIYATAA